MSGLRARFDLVADVRAARAGRLATAEVLASWGVPSYGVDDALLIVSELVTNAVLHAGDGDTYELEVAFDDDWLRISLTDGSPTPPQRRAAEPGDEGGRGVAIMDALADRWGVHRQGRGKRTWFEVDLDRLAPTTAEQAGDDAWDATDHRPFGSSSRTQDA